MAPNILESSVSAARQLFTQEVFEAAVISQTSSNRVTIRRPNSAALEGPYSCLGNPPPVGSIVAVLRAGLRYFVLTHTGHTVIGNPPTANADYSSTPSDTVILIDASSGDVTVSLSPLYAVGSKVYLKRLMDGGTNVVSITDPSCSVEGVTLYDIPDEGDGIILVKGSATAWYVVASYP